MTIDFACMNCNKTIRAPNESAGLRGRCPKCRRKVIVPSPGNDGEDISDQMQLVPHPAQTLQIPESPYRRRRCSIVSIILSGFIALFGCFCVFGGIVHLMNPSGIQQLAAAELSIGAFWLVLGFSLLGFVGYYRQTRT